MTGNLVISVIAGTLTYIVLWIMGVPYKGVVALFVGFADLIPLIGATLGAIVAIAVAALHSLPAALVVLVFFVVYQQAENHLLQPVIVSRTVQLSALMVTIAILLGVELLGFLGALLAIPVAGILHVIGRDLYDGYRGRLGELPPRAAPNTMPLALTSSSLAPECCRPAAFGPAGSRRGRANPGGRPPGRLVQRPAQHRWALAGQVAAGAFGVGGGNGDVQSGERTAWRALANRCRSPNSAQMLTAAGPADPIAAHERLAARLAAGDVGQGGVQLVELGIQEVDHAQG